MSEQTNASGAQFRADRPREHEAVTTTIVGGRPPGSGQPVGNIPRGMEVLVKKAAVDPEFRALLLAQRDQAAQSIGLTLEPAEAMMLRGVPAAQLQKIIAETVVPEEHRRTFLSYTGVAMLAILVGTVGAALTCSAGQRAREQKEDWSGTSLGNRPY
jgi:hypothetical protein